MLIVYNRLGSFLSIYISIHKSIYLSFDSLIYSSILLSIHLSSIKLSNYQSNHLFIYQYIHLSNNPTIYLFNFSRERPSKRTKGIQTHMLDRVAALLLIQFILLFSTYEITLQYIYNCDISCHN